MESWKEIEIFSTGDEYFDALEKDIEVARNSIILESYIFTYDRLTLRLLKALGEAHGRGCSVQILVDGFGSYKDIPRLRDHCQRLGIIFRVYKPMPYPLAIISGLLMDRLKNGSDFFKKMNARNHRKVIVIDKTISYLGSLNFTEVHCSRYVGNAAWRDTGIRLVGEDSLILALSFKVTFMQTLLKDFFTWVSKWRIDRPDITSSIHLNTTKKLRRLWYRNLVKKIHRAETRIYITTAYFLPRRSIMKALSLAKKKGVDVKILIPGKSDTQVVKWASHSILRFLIEKGVEVYEYQPSVLHAKSMIIDKECFIGSFNFNHRSMLHDLEVEVALSQPEALQKVLSLWENDLTVSEQKDSQYYTTRSYLLKSLHRFAFKMRYML